MTQQIPFQAQQPAFGKMSNIARMVNMTPDERKKYNISIDEYRTNKACMEFERAEGVAEGMAKGRADRDTELASIMRSQGYTEEQIAALLG